MQDQIKVRHAGHLLKRIDTVIHHGIGTTHLLGLLVLSSTLVIQEIEDGLKKAGLAKNQIVETRSELPTFAANRESPPPASPQITLKTGGILLSVPYSGPSAIYSLEDCMGKKKPCRTFTFKFRVDAPSTLADEKRR
jgi:hypothetical protein